MEFFPRLCASLLWLVPAAAPSPLSAQAAGEPRKDVVELLDGKRLEGRVVFEDEQRVVLRVGSKESEFERAKVKSVRSLAGSLREALTMWDRLEEPDAGAILDLARFCQSRGLEGEANLFGLLVLTEDPGNEAAHRLCGHEPRGDGWMFLQGRKKRPFPKDQGVRDWKEAWRLETTHYALTTNLDLGAACTLALELELFYRNFFTWLAPKLELQEVVEPMACEVHAERESYPNDTNRVAYFDGQKNLLVELAIEGFVLDVLLHEATHQLLHNTAVATRMSRGLIPPWLDEGLAEYLSSSRQGPPGHALYAEDGRIAEHFACHREARKPYDLARVLSFGAGDFGVSSKTDLKYAQSYTLVHFCLRGNGGAYRKGFLELLRRAYQGHATSDDFKESLEIQPREFEKAWNAYVAGNK